MNGPTQLVVNAKDITFRWNVCSSNSVQVKLHRCLYGRACLDAGR